MSGSMTKRLRLYWTTLIEQGVVDVSFRAFKTAYKKAVTKPVLPSLKAIHND